MGLFCPKCGSLLKPKKTETTTTMACSCGFESNEKNTVITERLKDKNKIEIVSEKQELLPISSAECDKCGNKEAYYWLVQTRAGDEPETKFLKCTKCQHTWRDYS